VRFEKREMGFLALVAVVRMYDKNFVCPDRLRGKVSDLTRGIGERGTFVFPRCFRGRSGKRRSITRRGSAGISAHHGPESEGWDGVAASSAESSDRAIFRMAFGTGDGLSMAVWAYRRGRVGRARV